MPVRVVSRSCRWFILVMLMYWPYVCLVASYLLQMPNQEPHRWVQLIRRIDRPSWGYYHVDHITIDFNPKIFLFLTTHEGRLQTGDRPSSWMLMSFLRCYGSHWNQVFDSTPGSSLDQSICIFVLWVLMAPNDRKSSMQTMIMIRRAPTEATVKSGARNPSLTLFQWLKADMHRIRNFHIQQSTCYHKSSLAVFGWNFNNPNHNLNDDGALAASRSQELVGVLVFNRDTPDVQKNWSNIIEAYESIRLCTLDGAYLPT